jgi:hypothetical protein
MVAANAAVAHPKGLELLGSPSVSGLFAIPTYVRKKRRTAKNAPFATVLRHVLGTVPKQASTCRAGLSDQYTGPPGGSRVGAGLGSLHPRSSTVRAKAMVFESGQTPAHRLKTDRAASNKCGAHNAGSNDIG